MHSFLGSIFAMGSGNIQSAARVERRLAEGFVLGSGLDEIVS